MNTNPAGRILIVDDEEPLVDALCTSLSMKGYATTGYHSAKKAVAEVSPGEFDLVLTDLSMPEMDGITLLRLLRDVDATLCGVVMTGHGSIDSAVSAMQTGAVNYIQKPFKIGSILKVISQALEAREARLQEAAAKQRDREYLSELEAANQQLETFAHSVAHDLRSPLHAIDGFCELYLSEYADSISDEGRNLLEHVTTAAQRMSQLIVDLLAFCESSKRPLARGPVEIGDLVARVVSQLAATAPERTVDWRIGELPRCDADPSLLEQVFVNLLSNALKFTGGRVPAVIEAGTLERGGERLFFVRDNGVGFDMEQAGRLFEAFTRLHSASAFEGTGIGLSIVRNIVERHGGRIWAESALGAGATFFFTLSRES
ncbi:MAG TPA: ATP-binding protein [Steroidobacteraceae bacterium]|nr:ATP-binding protein [Steroidobacteraceae bacterium]